MSAEVVHAEDAQHTTGEMCIPHGACGVTFCFSMHVQNMAGYVAFCNVKIPVVSGKASTMKVVKTLQQAVNVQAAPGTHTATPAPG